MSDRIDIKIEGLEALKATFEQLATKDASRCIMQALQAGAVIEQAAISAGAPVKDSTGGMLPDGALKADIEIKTHRPTGKPPYITVAPGKYTAHVARWVEYGHRLIRGGYSKLLKSGKSRGPGNQIGDVPAHPFVRPAYEESQKAVATAIETTLLDAITKAATKKGK